jgi:hypothetical protein
MVLDWKHCYSMFSFFGYRYLRPIELRRSIKLTLDNCPTVLFSISDLYTMGEFGKLSSFYRQEIVSYLTDNVNEAKLPFYINSLEFSWVANYMCDQMHRFPFAS